MASKSEAPYTQEFILEPLLPASLTASGQRAHARKDLVVYGPPGTRPAAAKLRGSGCCGKGHGISYVGLTYDKGSVDVHTLRCLWGPEKGRKMVVLWGGLPGYEVEVVSIGSGHQVAYRRS